MMKSKTWATSVAVEASCTSATSVSTIDGSGWARSRYLRMILQLKAGTQDHAARTCYVHIDKHKSYTVWLGVVHLPCPSVTHVSTRAWIRKPKTLLVANPRTHGHAEDQAATRLPRLFWRLQAQESSNQSCQTAVSGSTGQRPASPRPAPPCVPDNGNYDNAGAAGHELSGN